MILGILGMTIGLYHAMAKLRDMTLKRMGVLSLAIPSLCCGGHLQAGLLSGSLLAHRGENSTCCSGKTWLLCVQAALWVGRLPRGAQVTPAVVTLSGCGERGQGSTLQAPVAS